MYIKTARFLAIGIVTLIAAVCPAQAARQSVSLEDRFKAADRDHDGSLDRAEAKALPGVAKHFDALDADHTGKVTMVELRASLKAKRQAKHERAAKRFQAADLNHDGALNRQESEALPNVAKNFSAIDTDRSGSVTEKEIHEFMKSRHAGRQNRGK